MPKTQFDYESKQLTRQKLVNFVIRHYPKINERREMIMACLPGAQALDIYRVSDVLGIPRYNVTGIERNRKIYREIAGQNLGINLFHGTARDFFEHAVGMFDLVSLDYFGMLTHEAVDTIWSIFNRELLKSPGVLHTNFYGSREGKAVKQQYKSPSFSDALARSLPRRLSLEKERTKLDLVTKWNESYNVKLSGLIESMLSVLDRQYEDDMEEVDGRQLESVRDGIVHCIISAGLVNKNSLMAEKYDKVDKTSLGMEMVARDFDSKCENIPYPIRDYITLKSNDSYFCDDLESYKYVSNDGSPMLTDMFLFDQHKEWFDEKKRPISFRKEKDSKGEVIKVRIGNTELDELTDYGSPFIKSNIAYAHEVSGRMFKKYGNVSRQFLSSSGMEEKTISDIGKQALSKNEIISLLKEGRTPKWIAENYPDLDTNQLRAYKAWITMGKY